MMHLIETTAAKLLLVITIGTVLKVLFAPDRGNKTRKNF